MNDRLPSRLPGDPPDEEDAPKLCVCGHRLDRHGEIIGCDVESEPNKFGVKGLCPCLEFREERPS